jgi:uncharacterized protein with HEPN domain
MDNRSKKLLFDVLDSGRSVREWCERRTFDEYRQDRQFRRAVEREFEIIGEALARLARADKEAAEAIEDLDRIVGFRNRIIHGYDAVDDAIVWGIAEDYLPRLLVQVSNLLREAGEES